MKPIDLMTRIGQTVARETSGNVAGYGDKELTFEDLVGLKWAVSRVFHSAIREVQDTGCHVGKSYPVPMQAQMEKAAK